MRIASIQWQVDFGMTIIVELDTTTFVGQVSLIQFKSLLNILMARLKMKKYIILTMSLNLSLKIASQEWCEFISDYECNDEYVKIHCPETCSSKSKLIFLMNFILLLFKAWIFGKLFQYHLLIHRKIRSIKTRRTLREWVFFTDKRGLQAFHWDHKKDISRR